MGEERPSWWADVDIVHDGELIGVVENVRGAPHEAVLITSLEVIIIDEPCVRRVFYDEMVSIAPISDKEDIPEDIHILRRTGAVFLVPVRGRTGAIVDVIRFILCAMREARIVASAREPD